MTEPILTAPVMVDAAGRNDRSRWSGHPLPEDKFARLGTCASTGRHITICYQTYGDPEDPCLLLVMGLGGTLLLWRKEFLDRLVKAGFYVVIYDNRDVGLSTHLDGCPTVFIARMVLPTWASIGEGEPPYTLYDMAEDGLRLLSAIGVQKAHVLGTSMGGMIVQCMALRHPERLHSLSIVYSHSAGPHVKPQTIGMSLALLKKPAGNSLEDLVNFKVQNAALYTGEYAFDEANARRVAETNLRRCPDDKDGLLRQIWAIQRAENREPGLQRMTKMPTLIVHGMQDTMVPFENGLQLARLVEGSRLVAFGRMGHSLPVDLLDTIVAEVALQKKMSTQA